MRLSTRVRSTLVAVTAAAVVAGGGVAAGSAFAERAPGLATVAADPALTARLDDILAKGALAGATASLQVRDGVTGDVVYSRRSADRVIPASNQKLLTSAAALEVLGPGHRFRTKALSTGTRSGTTLRGDLYLKGYGDPTLTTTEFDKIAKAVAATGIRSVTGALVADDSYFDNVRLGTDWAWDDETYASHAPVSALTAAVDSDFNVGSVIVQAKPGASAGRPAAITVVPADSGVTISNQTTTGAAGSKDTVVAHRSHGTNTVVVTGSSPLGGAQTGDAVSVLDPTTSAASIFRAALSRHGVRVAKATRTGVAPSSARTLEDHRSTTLRSLLRPFLKLSNNGHAEILVKAMGRKAADRGTWEAGLAAADKALAGLGVDTAVIRSVDGSGLSRRNWLTTGQIANLLVTAQSKSWFDPWYAALPLAGDPDRLEGGTLRLRMTSGPAAKNLRAKTGTLTGVAALSGYVQNDADRRLVFSMVVNNALANVNLVLDEVGTTLAASGGAGFAAARVAVPPGPVATRDGEDVECSWVLAC